jgi:hypothetical protein
LTFIKIQQESNLDLTLSDLTLSDSHLLRLLPASAKQSLLENKIQNLIVMKGGMGKKQRKAALKALESLPEHAEKAFIATGRYLGKDSTRKDLIRHF